MLCDWNIYTCYRTLAALVCSSAILFMKFCKQSLVATEVFSQAEQKRNVRASQAARIEKMDGCA